MWVKLALGVAVFLAILALAVWVQTKLKGPDDRLKDAEIARQRAAKEALEQATAAKNEIERKEMLDDTQRIKKIEDPIERRRAALELLRRHRLVGVRAVHQGNQSSS